MNEICINYYSWKISINWNKNILSNYFKNYYTQAMDVKNLIYKHKFSTQIIVESIINEKLE